MNDSFGATAARLAGIAGAVLGWSADRFWNATPAELAAVLNALNPEDEQGLTTGGLRHLMELFPDG